MLANIPEKRYLKSSGIENWRLDLYPKVRKKIQKTDILNVNLGTKLTFYLKFGVTSHIVCMYLCVATIEIKSNKGSDQLLESTSKFTFLIYLHIYNLDRPG